MQRRLKAVWTAWPSIEIDARTCSNVFGAAIAFKTFLVPYFAGVLHELTLLT
jgi:hypothetical protein